MITLPRGRGPVSRRNVPSVASRLDLSRFLDRILQVERDGVGFAGQRLREQLGPRRGHKQLAAHEDVHRCSAPRAAPRPDDRSHAAQPVDLLVGVAEPRQDLARVLPQLRRREGRGGGSAAEMNRMRHAAVATDARVLEARENAFRRPPADARTCPRPGAPPRRARARRTAPPIRGRCAACERRPQPRARSRRHARPASSPCRSADRVASSAQPGQLAQRLSRSAACWRRCRDCRASSGAVP